MDTSSVNRGTVFLQKINHGTVSFQEIIKFLKAGAVGVMPTDTIYGIVGSALIPNSVEEIYRLRKRSKDKPMIILISEITDLNFFNIKLTAKQENLLKKIWPNPVSVVLPCPDIEFTYLHRGKYSLAFRIPKNKTLLNILKESGPLVAPSANFEGELPSTNIAEAKKYFGKKVTFYIDGGKINRGTVFFQKINRGTISLRKIKSRSSTIIKLKKNGSFEVLREGSFKLKEIYLS